MIAFDSPLINIPVALDKRQAVFLDGIRQNAQIAIYAYNRLCESLYKLAIAREMRNDLPHEFTGVFLDAWAYVEAIDRFRHLWMLQPASDTILKKFSPRVVNDELKSIRNLRNVYSHIAQKIDQIVSLNSSVSGSIRWITMLSKDPIIINTYFIRPGVIHGQLNQQFAMPEGQLLFTYETASVILSAGNHEGNLSKAYVLLCSIIDFAEKYLESQFSDNNFKARLPSDVFGSARLVV